MSVIDEIEAELKDLAAEPKWRRSEYGFTRIKLLLNYVKATEKLLKTWKPLQLAAMSEDLQHARKALGLEDR